MNTFEGRIPKLRQLPVVGAVLLASGAAKLARRADPDRADDMSTAARKLLPEYIATCLAVLEISVGSSALFPRFKRAVSVFGIGFFGIGAIVFAVIVRSGTKVSCGCFGASSSLITGKTVARNLFLMLLSLYFSLQATAEQPTQNSINHRPRKLESALPPVLLALSVLLGSLLLKSRRSLVTYRPLRPLLTIGERTPDVLLFTPNGETARLLDRIAARREPPVLLLVGSTMCQSCLQFWETVISDDLEDKTVGRIIFIWSGTPADDIGAFLSRLSPSPQAMEMLFDPDFSLRVSFGLTHAPALFVTNQRGVVLEPPAVSTESALRMYRFLRSQLGRDQSSVIVEPVLA